MKVFLDECVDWRRSPAIRLAIKNGTLLDLPCKAFDVFIAVDRQTAHLSQNRAAWPIAVCPGARTNRLAHLMSLLGQTAATKAVKPGAVQFVGERQELCSMPNGRGVSQTTGITLVWRLR
ncbi:MAG: hypothetical protein J2P50_16310 [Hyphomicrobiaceae bacterium]|nr:hypothetical protein [Hyphomicrobiaceae bacterium]